MIDLNLKIYRRTNIFKLREIKKSKANSQRFIKIKKRVEIIPQAINPKVNWNTQILLKNLALKMK
jgi:hypothetical protein